MSIADVINEDNNRISQYDEYSLCCMLEAIKDQGRHSNAMMNFLNRVGNQIKLLVISEEDPIDPKDLFMIQRYIPLNELSEIVGLLFMLDKVGAHDDLSLYTMLKEGNPDLGKSEIGCFKELESRLVENRETSLLLKKKKEAEDKKKKEETEDKDNKKEAEDKEKKKEEK